MTREFNPLVRRLGVAAGALGLAATLAGSPYAANQGRVDVAALSRAVAQEDDHVTAVELAGWIKERRRLLRIVDIRSAAEFDAYHVPTAERVPIDSLASTSFRRDETIVLYSEGGAHAAQAWVFLRALGYDRVFFLRGGLYEWLDEVMNPAIAPAASQKNSAAFATVAEISRYFGGTPHVGVPSALDEVLLVPGHLANNSGHTPTSQSSAALVTKIRRRGC